MANIKDSELIDAVAHYTKGSRDIAEHLIQMVREHDNEKTINIMIKTKKLKIIEDSHNGFIVLHEFFPDNDKRRHTDFYICGNEKAAQTLIRCIRKPNDKVE